MRAGPLDRNRRTAETVSSRASSTGWSGKTRSRASRSWRPTPTSRRAMGSPESGPCGERAGPPPTCPGPSPLTPPGAASSLATSSPRTSPVSTPCSTTGCTPWARNRAATTAASGGSGPGRGSGAGGTGASRRPSTPHTDTGVAKAVARRATIPAVSPPPSRRRCSSRAWRRRAQASACPRTRWSGCSTSTHARAVPGVEQGGTGGEPAGVAPAGRGAPLLPHQGARLDLEEGSTAALPRDGRRQSGAGYLLAPLVRRP